MATISTNEAVAISFPSKRTKSGNYYIWSTIERTHRIEFGQTIPAGAVVNSAIITFHIPVSGDPAAGSYFTAAGNSVRTSSGTKSTTVVVEAGSSYYDLVMSFKGFGTEFSASTLAIDNIAMDISYTVPMSNWEMTTTTVSADGQDTLGVTITPANATSTHTVTYSFGSASQSFDLAAGATSHSYTVPIDWCNQMPNKTSDWGVVTLSTKDESGNVLGTENKTFTATVPANVVPTFTGLTFTPINQKWDSYVQGISSVTATITGASGVYGSTITGYGISGGGYSGTTSSLTTGVLNTIGTNTFAAWVQDSRGRITTMNNAGSIEVVAYSKPSLTGLTLTRCNQDGTANDEGTYLQCTPSYTWTSIRSNAATITVSEHDSETETWTSIYTGSPDSGTSLTLGSGSFAADKSYQILVTVADQVASSSLTRQLASSAVYLDLQPDRLGVGCFAESENRVRIADDWEFMVGGKVWTDTVDEKISANAPVKSVNGLTGVVTITIPAAPSIIKQTDFGSAYFYQEANSTTTLSNLTVTESGMYYVSYNIRMVNTLSGRAFATFDRSRVSFPSGVTYPDVQVASVLQMEAGTQYPLTFWYNAAGTLQYEDILLTVVKLA